MGKSWRYTTKFEWQEIADTLVSQALSKAKEAQSTADGESTTYLAKPTRYEKGDTWLLESDMFVGGKSYKAGTLLFATADSEVFVGTHWQDKTRYIGAIEIAESERKSKEAWEKYANAQATNAGSDALRAAKEYAEAQDKLLKTQTDAYADGVLTKAEQNALTVAKTQANLAEEQAKAYADGRVTEAEQAAIDKAKQAYTDAVAKAKELDGEIQVGGRNLAKVGDPYYWNGVKPFNSPSGAQYYADIDTSQAPHIWQIEARAANDIAVGAEFGWIWNNTPQVKVTLSKEWKRVVSPINQRKGAIGLWCSKRGAYIELRHIKLERGTVATDWTPAPE